MYKYIQFLLLIFSMLQIYTIPVEFQRAVGLCHQTLTKKNYDEFCAALEKVFETLERDNARINPSMGLSILNNLFNDIVTHSKNDAQFVIVYFEMLAIHEVELYQRYHFNLFESLYSGCGKTASADSWLHSTLEAENPTALKVLLELAANLVAGNHNLIRVWKNTITMAMRAAKDEESLRLLLAHGADPFAMPKFYWRILIAGADYWKMLHEVFDADTLVKFVGSIQMFRIALRNQDAERAQHYMSDYSHYSLLTNDDTSTVADLWRSKPDLGVWKTVTKIFSAEQLQDSFGCKVAFYSAVLHGDVAMAKNLLELGDSHYGNVELLQHIKEIGLVWLFIAAKYNYMAIKLLLIQHGVSAQRTLLFSSGITHHLTPIEKAYAEEILFLTLEHFEEMNPEHAVCRRQLTCLISQ